MEDLKDYGLAIEVEKIANAIENTADETYGKCAYCESEELVEVLEDNNGHCENCAEEMFFDYRGVR